MPAAPPDPASGPPTIAQLVRVREEIQQVGAAAGQWRWNAFFWAPMALTAGGLVVYLLWRMMLPLPIWATWPLGIAAGFGMAEWTRRRRFRALREQLRALPPELSLELLQPLRRAFNDTRLLADSLARAIQRDQDRAARELLPATPAGGPHELTGSDAPLG